jgi:hypothetical protein
MFKRLIQQLSRRNTPFAAQLDNPNVKLPMHLAHILPKLVAPDSKQLPTFFMPAFWHTSDANAVAEGAKKLTSMMDPGYFFADNLLTWSRNLSMLDDKAFVVAWESNIESPSDQAIVWRRYVLACAGYHCVQLDGDFVECGAYTGVGVKTVMDYLGGTSFPKNFWAYDIFEHDDSMLNHSMPEHGKNLFQRVKNKFEEYPNARVIKGLIPDVFNDGCPQQISYLHIDLNQAVAEVAALEVLFDRMVPGGILILDDYEWAGMYRDQKLTEDLWFEERKYRVMPLPTGQGLVIKR